LTFHAVSYLDLVRGGLVTYSFREEIRLDISGPQTLDPISDSWSTISPDDSEDYIAGGGFTYVIPEFIGQETTSGTLVHAVHSSTNCTMLRLDGYKYWRDYGSDNQTSKGMLYKPHGWILMVGVMKLT